MHPCWRCAGRFHPGYARRKPCGGFAPRPQLAQAGTVQIQSLAYPVRRVPRPYGAGRRPQTAPVVHPFAFFYIHPYIGKFFLGFGVSLQKAFVK